MGGANNTVVAPGAGYNKNVSSAPPYVPLTIRIGARARLPLPADDACHF